MFKKRPSTGATPQTGELPEARPPKGEVAHWHQRLFKNTFTYRGQRREVNGWSVKIQVQGRRKTFSLQSRNRTKAAAEACEIYETILTRGWDALPQRRHGNGFSDLGSEAQAVPGVATDADYWKDRLIHRRNLGPSAEASSGEWSVRIEHRGVGRYFLLGSDNEREAAARARQIHETLQREGWDVVNRRHPCELTLAFRWLENPLAWTYATLHTHASGDPTGVRSTPRSGGYRVAVLEAETGLRSALAAGINRQEGFHCCAAYTTAAEAAREITRQPVDLVLANHAMPDHAGMDCLPRLCEQRPGLVGLLYSVFEDSNQLFRDTPGGALGYLLKRTSPDRIFEPLATVAGPLTPEWVATQVRGYFQRLVTAMPSGSSALELARLTPREHEVLALLSKGDPAKEIASLLRISIWTVHGHIKSIFEKLEVHSRTEAVVKYLQK